MKATRKIFTGFIFILFLATSAYAAKWESFVFPENLDLGFAELERYCTLHDIAAADVLWANGVDGSGDIKAGTSIYLPTNQADLLAIWQNQGAWKPTALVPVTSAAAAKKIAVEHEKKVEAKKETAEKAIKALPHVTPLEEKPADPELQAKLEEIANAPKIESPAQVSQTAKANPKFPEIITDMKVLPPSGAKETPQDAIAKMAKPDKDLLNTSKKAAAPATDPIIVLSPNGDSSQGPMRLLIVGDKVEVVRIPENAAPKSPSVADLDHVFGTTPSYLPKSNGKDLLANFTINMRNLNLGGQMMWPVDGKVSSYFGMRGQRKHEGIDIPMPEGTPIRAARNGVVARTGNNSTMGFRGYGNFVLLDHGGGLQSFYAHCSRVAVVQGQRIMQGQVVGYVGSTGRSTANHLHFEVRLNNAKVDPLPYLGGKTNLANNSNKK